MKKLRLGFIGGGPDAFIGGVHRIAFRIDDLYVLVCGAFSSDPQKSRAFGETQGLPKNRIYSTYQELFEIERTLPEEERMQVVSIVTPNHLHFGPAKMALEFGFHVIIEKPMTFNLEEALSLKSILAQSGKKLLLTHTYTGYPMVKEARNLILRGILGEIRKIYVEYPQGWLSENLEMNNHKQALWRTDPSKSGISGAMGDIGTHAFQLAEYVSGLRAIKICADINTNVEARKLDDDGAVLLKFHNGASGVLIATQIAAGEENNIKIRVYGEKGGIIWEQEGANSLQVKLLNQPWQIYRTGASYLNSYTAHNVRLPSGHPEGYLEAFANLYRNFALSLTDAKDENHRLPYEFPGIDDGIRGMLFIERVIQSGNSNEKWIEI